MTLRRALRSSLVGVALLATATGCMTLDTDLSTVTVPVSALPNATAGAEVEPSTYTAKHVLYVHGLLGEREPDVASMVQEMGAGHERINDFRITHGATFHDWLLTHLTGTLLRFKTVTIEGTVVR